MNAEKFKDPFMVRVHRAEMRQEAAFDLAFRHRDTAALRRAARWLHTLHAMAMRVSMVKVRVYVDNCETAR